MYNAKLIIIMVKDKKSAGGFAVGRQDGHALYYILYRLGHHITHSHQRHLNTILPTPTKDT